MTRLLHFMPKRHNI